MWLCSWGRWVWFRGMRFSWEGEAALAVAGLRALEAVARASLAAGAWLARRSWRAWEGEEEEASCAAAGRR